MSSSGSVSNGQNNPFRLPPEHITLISSDGRELEVLPHVLMMISPVFVDLINASNNSRASGEPIKIELTDPELETGNVIGCALKCIQGTLDISEYSYEDLLPFVRFLDKFDCTILVRHFYLHLCEHLLEEHDSDPIKVFVLAAHLDDPDLCVRAMRCGKDTYDRAEVRGVGRGDNSTWDITAWDQEAFERLPRAYAWALMRATRGKCLDRGHEDWEAVIDNLVSYLDEATFKGRASP